jgi:hypothetical protein
MKMIALEAAPPTVHAEPGDLHASVSGERLLVPQEVLKALSGQRLRTGEELYSFLSTFPTACATLFNWSVNDCRRAANRLGGLLNATGHGLPSQKYDEPGMGALDPDLLP